MEKLTRKRIGVLLAAGAMILLVAATSLADTFVHGGSRSGWRLDSSRSTTTDVYK